MKVVKQRDELLNLEEIEALGDAHSGYSIETPLKEDAFALDDKTKMDLIEDRFADIMDIMGLDLSDDSLKGTPRRVAKMFIQEIFQGLNPENKPKMSLFDNKYGYDQMLVERDISFRSTCEHHFLPIIGKAHIGYISNGKVIGLSKLNRIVQYYAKRPQVQERMTVQIIEDLKEILDTEHVAVVVDAVHTCVTTRGVEDISSSTVTTQYSGLFNECSTKAEFLQFIKK